MKWLIFVSTFFLFTGNSSSAEPRGFKDSAIPMGLKENVESVHTAKRAACKTQFPLLAAEVETTTYPQRQVNVLAATQELTTDNKGEFRKCVIAFYLKRREIDYGYTDKKRLKNKTSYFVEDNGKRVLRNMTASRNILSQAFQGYVSQSEIDAIKDAPGAFD